MVDAHSQSNQKPFVVHTMTSVFCRTEHQRGMNTAYRRLALCGGTLLLVSGILAWVRGPLNQDELHCLALRRINMDWMRGNVNSGGRYPRSLNPPPILIQGMTCAQGRARFTFSGLVP